MTWYHSTVVLMVQDAAPATKHQDSKKEQRGNGSCVLKKFTGSSYRTLMFITYWSELSHMATLSYQGI